MQNGFAATQQTRRCRRATKDGRGKQGAPAGLDVRPRRGRAKPASLKVLVRALALIMGPEATIVVKDVLQLDDADARKVKRWAIRALVEAARKSPGRTDPRKSP
jgi:hypothetical protein